MRRAFIGLAVAAAAVLALAGPANAAPGQVTRIHFNGPDAFAFWSVPTSATTYTDTVIGASTTKGGSSLFVDRFLGTLDANGNFIGGTDTQAAVTSGFTFTIDATKLTGASVSGSGLPATTCVIDAQGNPVGPCTRHDDRRERNVDRSRADHEGRQ
jgi:hypothetical protein